jgi:3-hydroxybutyryl-CoA dehydrogenase
MKTLQKDFENDKYIPCPMLESYVANGLLGKKTKKGFYQY